MKIASVLKNIELILQTPQGFELIRKFFIDLAIKGKLDSKSSDDDSSPSNWLVVPANQMFKSSSGNSKLIKGKLFNQAGPKLFPGYSASGQDVWLSDWEHQGVAVILSAVGARCGKAFLATGKWSAIANTHIIWIDEEFFLPEFAYLILNNEDFWIRSGSAQPFVKVKSTLEKLIGVPSLEEQKLIISKIKAFTSMLADLQVAKHEHINLSSRARESALNSISTAQTQEEFNTAWNRIQQNWEVIAGTPESVKDIRRLIVHLGLSGWLTKNLSDFQDKALGEIVTLINGRAYKQQELLQSGIPVIRIQNLNGGNNWFYSNLELPMDKKCVSGDLLFAWSASFGPYIWNGPEAIYHYHIWKVVPSSYVTKDYLYYLLQDKTEEIKSASHGLAMLHMTKSGMESMMVRIPSIEQQNHAVRMIKELLGICDELEACLIAKDEFSEKLSRSIVSASA
jgi:restriction endonuclease S subunit